MRVRLIAFCFVSSGASFVAAQPNPVPKVAEPVEVLPAIFAPHAPPKNAKSDGAARPAAAIPPSNRAISSEMAAKLSAVATRIAPSASATPLTDGAATVSADSTDAVQLTPYIVREGRLPKFKEYELLTSKGKLALARARYPGLMTDAAAVKRLEDDLFKDHLKEMSDLAHLLEIGGKPFGDAKRTINAAKHAEPFPPGFGEPVRTPR